MMSRALALLLLLLPYQVPAPGPQFEAHVDRVSVDLSVQRGNTSVRGLTAADFDVWDNGVPQRVREVIPDARALDVTLVLDISNSVESQNKRPLDEIRESVKRLRKEDRLRLIVFGSHVLEVTPFRSPDAFTLPTLPANSTWSAVNEALIVAASHQAPVDRRHLIIARTDAVDTISLAPVKTAAAIVRQSSAALHLVVPYSSDDIKDKHDWITSERAFPPVLKGIATLEARDLLMDAAVASGGLVFRTGGVFRQNLLVPPFTSITDDARQSYRLEYELSGVRPEGWHDIKVAVKRPGDFKVRARQGYAIAAGSSSKR
jgi:VWFA-related protein